MAADQISTPSGSRESLIDIEPASPCRIRRRNSLPTHSPRNERNGDEDHDYRRVESPIDRMPRNAKLEDSRIRERLRLHGLTSGKNIPDKKSKGPMIAKPNSLRLSSSTSNISQIASSPCKARTHRSPSSTSESTFAQQVLSRPPSPKTRRSPSNSHRVSSTSGRRTPSPNSTDLGLCPEVAKKRVDKAMKARLYLLQLTGPNSFLVGGDSPDHKFKVRIGPQTCSCGRGTHCIHVLFIMLRVFKLKENDPCLWRKTLKNYEVDQLMKNFDIERKAKCQREKKKKQDKDLRASQESLNDCDPNAVNECPICLLEMIDGESLVVCEKGCQNKLHHHCIAVWLEECRSQDEPLLCPLCRSEWSMKQINRSSTDEDDTSRPVTPQSELPPSGEYLPHADSIPAENMEMAKPWISVFGEELISCIFSRNWTVRETALRHLSQRIVKKFSVTSPAVGNEEIIPCLRAACGIFEMVLADPVYKVYVATLRAFRTMLGYIVCTTKEEVKQLQLFLKPVIEAILLKCADGNRKTSQLSVSTLVELAKGQRGEMSVGRKIGFDGYHGIDGVSFLVECIIQDLSTDNNQWQYRLGRICALEKLVDKFPSHFILRPYNSDSFGNSLPRNYYRLMSVVKFGLKDINHSHARIGKIACRLFINAGRLSAHMPDIYSQVSDLLGSLDRSLHIRMKQKLNHAAEKLSTTQQVALLTQTDGNDVTEFESHDNGKAKDQNQSESRTPSPPHSPVLRRKHSKKSNIPRPRSQEITEKSSLPNKDDLKSLSLSPTTPEIVDFKTEVTALHPNIDRKPVFYQNYVVDGKKCKDDIALEEAKALISTLEASTQELPKIPSITPDPDGKVINIQPALGDSGSPAPSPVVPSGSNLYQEGIHWTKGDYLGHGAFSTCYKAIDKKSGVIMTVKQLPMCRNSEEEEEEAITDVSKEIKTMIQLNHPNVLRLFGATQEGNHFNLFVEWMPGGSVEDLLNKYGAFSESVMLNYSNQLFRGLAFMHEHKVIHRDLKGANLLVNSTGQQIRIADFGAAARLSAKVTFAGEFKGQLLGTVAFMAPEILRGEDYGRSCDIWSAGCTMIQMATAAHPWGAKELPNHMALIYKIASATQPHPIPEHLPPPFRDFMLRCLELKAEDRALAKDLLNHPLFTSYQSAF